MSYPDNFNTAAFDAYWGGPKSTPWGDEDLGPTREEINAESLAEAFAIEAADNPKADPDWLDARLYDRRAERALGDEQKVA